MTLPLSRYDLGLITRALNDLAWARYQLSLADDRRDDRTEVRVRVDYAASRAAQAAKTLALLTRRLNDPATPTRRPA